MCKLIRKEDSAPVAAGATITDQMGRQWYYEDCISATPKSPAIVVALRALPDGKRAATPTNFALAMFPHYRVSVAK